MSVNYESRYAVGPKEFQTLDTEGLRDNFLIKKLFSAGEINVVYTHYDRYIVGGVLPTAGAIQLETIEVLLKEPDFLARREIGIINVGGDGIITVDGERFDVGHKEALYIGKGAKDVLFDSNDTANPAKFYFNSTPAHHRYPTRLVTKKEAKKVELGSPETANHRIINQMLLHTVIQTCQLQMGMTELQSGSIWNTMPAHTHDRRMEVYFYFDLAEEQAVSHFMGPVDETRHIWLHNEQAVISPPWSIHAGAGTSNYTFIWGMAGENMDYDDMDKCSILDLK